MSTKLIAQNKRASYDFFLEEKYEAGLVLQGTEVKSLRQGKAQINESYISIDDKNEAWIHNMSIPHYEFGTYANHQETRKRKLLLNQKEIFELVKSQATKGLTIVATKLYFKDSRVKIEIALAKGKKLFDKRDTQAKKDVERKIRQGNYE